MCVFLSEIRQRTTGQRNVPPPTPSSPEQGSPKASGVQATSSVQRDTSAPGGPPERTVAPALQSNVLPRRPGSPTSIPGMGKQSTLMLFTVYIVFSGYQ